METESCPITGGEARKMEKSKFDSLCFNHQNVRQFGNYIYDQCQICLGKSYPEELELTEDQTEALARIECLKNAIKERDESISLLELRIEEMRGKLNDKESALDFATQKQAKLRSRILQLSGIINTVQDGTGRAILQAMTLDLVQAHIGGGEFTLKKEYFIELRKVAGL